MLEIKNIKIDGRMKVFGLSCDKPSISWELSSDKNNTIQANYHITVFQNEQLIWDSNKVISNQSQYIKYDGSKLLPHSKYVCKVSVKDNHGEIANGETSFFTGKLNEKLEAKWITSGKKNPKDNLLPIEMFLRKINLNKEIKHAVLYASALGIYEAELNGKKVGDEFFAPGYTSYLTYVQFQSYDVTKLMQKGENKLQFSVANGWYCGTVVKKNNFYGDTRAIIAELHILYSDGTRETIITDESWNVTEDGAIRYADFYNGEVIDNAYSCIDNPIWKNAIAFTQKSPELIAHIGAHVRVHSIITPINRYQDKNGKHVFDLGQNFSGIVRLTVKAKKDTRIIVRHAEITDNEGCISTENLRSAKAELALKCGIDGVNKFEPRFTFMGFRYVEVSSDEPFELTSLEGLVLTSDIAEIGEFECSNELVNRLWQNIIWGQRSNFLEIPTDCPQRNERLGWTGDIAVFASTAAYNADISLFMKKWLCDLRAEQSKKGLIPFTIPDTHGFTPFKIPTAGWGDAATMVPWAVYLSTGDIAALKEQYVSMKKWMEAEIRAAAVLSFGHKKYVWDKSMFQFGDWCAPGEGFKQWTKKGKWLATAYFANSARIMSLAASILAYKKDQEKYEDLFKKIKSAFCKEYLKEDGTLTGDFQSAYVCALYFDLLPENIREKAATHLANMIEKNDGCLATGFLGTPYITFALSDHGKEKEAYDLLLNEKCPGWLYTVKAGGTTIWERWDGLDENGKLRSDIGISDMISFNHYAYGAIGDWFYRRICGLETDYKNAGYKHYTVKPIPDRRFTYAATKYYSNYGLISVRWDIEGEEFILSVTVPANTTADIIMPNGEKRRVGSGKHQLSCRI